MSYNDKKIISILVEECEGVEERYTGYRDLIMELIGDVLALERENTIRRINVVQKISDKVSAAGQVLYRNNEQKRGE